MIDAIKENFNEEELLTADGFDDAIIGISHNINEPIRVIYSVSKCISILEIDMSTEDALEFFDFNISGAFVGDKTPIWCWDNL